MDKHNIKMIEYKIHRFMEEHKGIIPTLYTLLSIIDELGHLRKEAITKQVDMEEKGDIYVAVQGTD